MTSDDFWRERESERTLFNSGSVLVPSSPISPTLSVLEVPLSLVLEITLSRYIKQILRELSHFPASQNSKVVISPPISWQWSKNYNFVCFDCDLD